MDVSWSAAEKASTAREITRFDRWKKRRLAVGVAIISSLVLLLGLTSGFVFYFHANTPQMKTPAADRNPCDHIFCAFGAHCLVDGGTNQAYCRCPHECSEMVSFVCGDDDVTYDNDCLLKLSSCLQQRKITINRQGPCGVKDPCRNKICPFGAVCQPTADGKSAKCVCPESCDSKDVNLGTRPVCGTDGRNYPNACELRRVSCNEMKAIDIKYKGVCDPCDGVECLTFQVCQLDDSRNPICRCNSICSPDFRPVCGSDGKTYTNECTLRVESCKSKKTIRIIYTGDCSAGSNPCDSLQCGPGHECDIDRNGIATCQCNERCEDVMRPVCGSDGETYDNACELHRQACIQKKYIDVAYEGHCGERGPCFNYHCSFGATCVIKSEFPACECPTCTEEFEPLCGTDGISYTNQCKLRKEACEQKTEIAVAYSGLCNGCENKKCGYYAVCESDGRGNGKCTCPSSCIRMDAKVCGTDQVTYMNECEMRVAACRKSQYVMVVSKGPCDLCQHKKCKYGARCEEGRCVCPTTCPNIYEPVCANDGMTYSNECEMRQAACQNDQDLNILFYGECDEAGGTGQDMGSGSEVDCHSKSCKYGGECDYNEEGLPICVCNFECPAVLEPICASDGRLYDNDCRIKEQSCQTQKNLMPVHIEMCEEFREIPCDGETPLVDPSTGKEYFCGDGVGSKLCPLGSYCHKSSAFAKCCSEVILIKSCTESVFGCCMDGKTAAQGPNNAGCPSVCNCNRLGSYGLTCDPDSKQCQCKPGVGGPHCDRCEPGYWGLQKITDESAGCSPCACNLYGSVRDDCEQMTGRCVCKHGIQGMKCDVCPQGTVLGPDGCMDVSIAKPIIGSCKDLMCFHGAACQQTDNKAQCLCNFSCLPERNRNLVCGSDGNTYGSECQMKLFSCRYQKNIYVVSNSPCSKVLTSAEYVPEEHTIEPFIHYITFNNTFVTKRFRRHKAQSNSHIHNQKNVSSNCETEALNDTLAFCGYSYVAIPNHLTTGDVSFNANLKPLAKNGIILIKISWNSSAFFAVLMQRGHLEFRFDIGRGLSLMFSKRKLYIGKFYRFSLEFNSTFTSFKLNQNLLFSVATSDENHFADNSTLYFGSLPPSLQRFSRRYGAKEGLIGCVNDVRVGKRVITKQLVLKRLPETSLAQAALPVLDTTNFGCNKLCSCERNHKLKYCLPSCKYDLKHLGKTNVTLPVIGHQNEEPDLRADAHERILITMVFRTQSEYGQLLLWFSETNNYFDRRMRVSLNEGRLQLSIFSRGHLATKTHSTLYVANNRWHAFVIKWKERKLEFQVDQKSEIISTKFGIPQIKSFGYIILGSINVKKHTRALKSHSFDGCIKSVIFNDRRIDTENLKPDSGTCQTS